MRFQVDPEHLEVPEVPEHLLDLEALEILVVPEILGVLSQEVQLVLEARVDQGVP